MLAATRTVSHIDEDVGNLARDVIAGYRESAATCQNVIATSTSEKSTEGAKDLFHALQHGAQQMERALVSGQSHVGEAYGEGHEDTKFELARLIDAMSLQISVPLRQFEQRHLEQCDFLHMLDIVQAYKQVVLDILEQLLQPTLESKTPSLLSRISTASSLSKSKESRARNDSVQQDSASAISQKSTDSPSISIQDFSEDLPLRTLSRATTVSLPAESEDNDSRRPSTVANITTTSPTSTIAALSARFSSRNATPTHSRTPSRRAHAPEPVMTSRPAQTTPTKSSASGAKSAAAAPYLFGSMLHPSMTAPATYAPKPPPLKRTLSAQSNSSGALLAGVFLPLEHSLSHSHSHKTLHHHTQSGDDPNAPSKANHWHGFCKGAWMARQDPKKAFATHVAQASTHSRKEQWRCKDCHFTGNMTLVNADGNSNSTNASNNSNGAKNSNTAGGGGSKHHHHTNSGNLTRAFDNRVFVDAQTGIQFKWMFLAKSHMKVKEKGHHHHHHHHLHHHHSHHHTSTPNSGTATPIPGTETSPHFGCTECVEQGTPTATYPDAAALLAHISDAHPNGVKAAIRPPDPFWQGAIVAAEGEWDLYIPAYSDATTPMSPPLTWG